MTRLQNYPPTPRRKPTLRRFSDQYGSAVDLKVNAVAYDLTEGGDLVRGKPWTWEALRSHVIRILSLFDDTAHYSPERIRRELDVWLKVNEEKEQTKS